MNPNITHEMLKNKNIRFGFFVLVITIIGLMVYAEFTTTTSKKDISDTVKTSVKQELAIQP